MELFYLISTFDSRHMIKNVQALPLPFVVVNETSSQYGHRCMKIRDRSAKMVTSSDVMFELKYSE